MKRIIITRNETRYDSNRASLYETKLNKDTLYINGRAYEPNNIYLESWTGDNAFDNDGGIAQVGAVTVKTTIGRGFTIEEWAHRCTDRIIHVAPDSHSVLKDQAVAWKEQIRKTLIHYMTLAVKSDRTTLYNLLLKQGEREMAELLRKLSL